MIYLDSSIALANLFAEDRAPPGKFWAESLISSRLLQYEIWTRVHARETPILQRDAQALLRKIELLDLTPIVLARALQQFPVGVRTLDALHLATIDYLRRSGAAIELASYDRRMLACSRALRIPIHAF